MMKEKQPRVVLYLRVSTDEQTTDNQRRELVAVAARAGWRIVGEYVDAGISGATGRDKRPEFDALLRAAARREFDIVAAWSVDRLGRSLQTLVEFIETLKGLGVGLYLHQQGLDTSTPGGMAMFQMCGVFAEFERAMIRERIKSGLARVAVTGTKSGKSIGRPGLSAIKKTEIKKARALGLSLREVAKVCDVSLATVQKVINGIPAA